MSIIGRALFHRDDRATLDHVLRHQVEKLSDAVAAVPAAEFSTKSDEEIAAAIVAEKQIQPLEVDFASAVPNVEEVQVEVHDRFFDEGTVRVAGLRASKAIPFKGDPELWRLRPSPFTYNSPHGDVRGKNLIIGIAVPVQQADEAKRYLDELTTSLPEHLERQRAQIVAHNAALQGKIAPLVQQRRQRLGQASDLLRSL